MTLQHRGDLPRDKRITILESELHRARNLLKIAEKDIVNLEAEIAVWQVAFEAARKVVGTVVCPNCHLREQFYVAQGKGDRATCTNSFHGALAEYDKVVKC